MVPAGCVLIKSKETKQVSSCPYKGTKGKSSLEDCVTFLSQTKANTMNYSPGRQECNAKACKDKDDAMMNLGTYGSAEFDVIYCG